MSVLAAPRVVSKTKYVAGLQCHKRLWWTVHEPTADELIPGPTLQARFEEGHQVTAKAREYVPGGLLVSGRDLACRLDQTRALIAQGVGTLYEPVFEHQGTLAVADILERWGGRWKLTEVKASTRLKDEHVPDVAYQAYVARRAGLDVDRISVMHLNRECRFPELTDLFVEQDVTASALALQSEVADNLERFATVLDRPCPSVDPGSHCVRPYECPFMARCHEEPTLHAVATLYRAGKRLSSQLAALGCRTLAEIPPDVRLTAVQARQRAAALADACVVEPGLDASLRDLTLPIAFLDFETVNPAIPVWNGCRPYDHVPVQVSVHVLGHDGQLTHGDWLAPGPEDPRREMARRLLELTRGAQTVLVYHKPFEDGVIRELQSAVPDLATELEALRGRLVDLLPIIREHVYHPEFRGRFGIKSVFPALVPNCGYADLIIGDGGTATATLRRLLVDRSIPATEERATRAALREYCHQDTLAMTQVLSWLHERATAGCRVVTL